MATKKELLEESQKAIGEFFNLCSYVLGEDAPYDVNEIPEDNAFYETAKAISEEMGLDWSAMSHEDSNRVVINLLSEYFLNIRQVDKYKPVLTISFAKAE